MVLIRSIVLLQLLPYLTSAVYLPYVFDEGGNGGRNGTKLGKVLGWVAIPLGGNTPRTTSPQESNPGTVTTSKSVIIPKETTTSAVTILQTITTTQSHRCNSTKAITTTSRPITNSTSPAPSATCMNVTTPTTPTTTITASISSTTTVKQCGDLTTEKHNCNNQCVHDNSDRPNVINIISSGIGKGGDGGQNATGGDVSAEGTVKQTFNLRNSHQNGADRAHDAKNHENHKIMHHGKGQKEHQGKYNRVHYEGSRHLHQRKKLREHHQRQHQQREYQHREHQENCHKKQNPERKNDTQLQENARSL